MRKVLISLFILIIFSAQIIQSNSKADSVFLLKDNSKISNNFSIIGYDQSAVDNSGFEASVTILLSSLLYWVTDRTINNFINEIDSAINIKFPNVTTKFLISNYTYLDEVSHNELLTSINVVVNDTLVNDNTTKDYLITIGRNQAPFINDNRISFYWTNQSQYNNSVYKDVAFIDSNVGQLNNYSYQDYNQTEAGFLGGVWGAFSSLKQYAGALMVPGPEVGFSKTSSFVIMNSAFLSGLFAGFEYVRENYLDVRDNYLERVVFPVIAKGMDQEKYIIDLPKFSQELNPSIENLFDNEASKEETKSNAQEFFDQGIDTIVSLVNTGDEGLAQLLIEDEEKFGFFINSLPITGLTNAAFLYPNYTYAVLRQIEHWAQYNTTEKFQVVYHPNTPEYPLINFNSRLEGIENYQKTLSDLNESKISIPEEFLYCLIPGDDCEPEQVEIISGFEWSSLFILSSAMVIIMRLKKKFD